MANKHPETLADRSLTGMVAEAIGCPMWNRSAMLGVHVCDAKECHCFAAAKRVASAVEARQERE